MTEVGRQKTWGNEKCIQKFATEIKRKKTPERIILR
jgi:hypothetical protein